MLMYEYGDASMTPSLLTVDVIVRGQVICGRC